MALVPGFRHDIFVSYAHVDNQPVGDARTGWVTSLIDVVRNQLARIIGRQESVSLWMDPQLRGNGALTPEIADHVRESATLLAVFSPAYVASVACAQEMEAFLTAGGTHARRVFLIEPYPVGVAERPLELADVLGYRFWLPDGAGTARTFSVVPPRHDEDAFYDRVTRLVRDLAAELRALQAGAGAAVAGNRMGTAPQVPDSVLPAIAGQEPASPSELPVPPSERIRVVPLPDALRHPRASAGLFVGVGQFDSRSHLPSLRYAVDDAVGLAHLLVLELALIAPERATLALGGPPASVRGNRMLLSLRAEGVAVVPATRSEILYALDTFDEHSRERDGWAFASFSTHGYEDSGAVHLMPADGIRKFTASTGISTDVLNASLSASQAATKLLILDCCRSAIAGGVRGEETMSDRFRAALPVPAGTTLLASCGVGQLSWESPQFEQGIFTHFLLNGLRGAADHQREDGYIKLDDLLAYTLQGTNEWVKRNIRVEQLPWRDGASNQGDVPIGISVEARQKADERRQQVAERERRHEHGLRCFVEARLVAENRKVISPQMQDEVERALDQLSGEALDELIEMLGRLEDRKPVSCRSFAAWWRAEHPGTQLPSAPISVVRRTPRGARADAAWTNSLGHPFVPLGRVLIAVWQTRVQDFQVFCEYTGHDAENGLFSWDPVEGSWRPCGHTWRSHGFPQGSTHPVAGLSWEDADAYCRWLTEKERLEGYLDNSSSYRLPTDAEWSAAVGDSLYPWGETWPPPADAGNYALRPSTGELPVGVGRSRGLGTTPVGAFPANHLGVRDLGGNVWEWCDGWYGKELNPAEIRAEFKFLEADEGGRTYHFMRGGSWFNEEATQLRCAYRNRGNVPNIRFANVGFRCVLDLGQAPLTPLAQ